MNFPLVPMVASTFCLHFNEEDGRWLPSCRNGMKIMRCSGSFLWLLTKQSSLADALQSLWNVARGTVSVSQKQNCPFPSYEYEWGSDSEKSHLDGLFCCVFLCRVIFTAAGSGRGTVMTGGLCVLLLHTQSGRGVKRRRRRGNVSGLFAVFKLHLGSSLNSFPLISFPVVAFSVANHSPVFYLTDPPPLPPLQSSSSSSLTLPWWSAHCLYFSLRSGLLAPSLNPCAPQRPGERWVSTDVPVCSGRLE